MKNIGEKYGKKPAQVALNRLIMYSPIVVPILGTKTPKQVEDLARAVGWRLSSVSWRAIDELSKSIRIVYSVLPGLQPHLALQLRSLF